MLIVMLVVCWYLPYKAKKIILHKNPMLYGGVECYEKNRK